MPAKPDEYLNSLWEAMRDDCSPSVLARAYGAVHAFEAVGILTIPEMEAWILRFSHCPGHGDEDGRAWCAYCGDLEGARR